MMTEKQFNKVYGRKSGLSEQQMKGFYEIYVEFQNFLKENNCHIRSEMGFEDEEEYTYLIRKTGDFIEKIKIEDTLVEVLGGKNEKIFNKNWSVKI